MKILHVLAGIDPRYGGPTTALLGLAQAQRAAGLVVSIAATHNWPLPENSGIDELKTQGITVDLPYYRPWQVGSIRCFAESLQRQVAQSDIVHIHALWNSEQHLAARFAHELGKPFVFRTCGMLAPWSLTYHRWRKKL